MSKPLRRTKRAGGFGTAMKIGVGLKNNKSGRYRTKPKQPVGERVNPSDSQEKILKLLFNVFCEIASLTIILTVAELLGHVVSPILFIYKKSIVRISCVRKKVAHVNRNNQPFIFLPEHMDHGTPVDCRSRLSRRSSGRRPFIRDRWRSAAGDQFLPYPNNRLDRRALRSAFVQMDRVRTAADEPR